MRAKRGVIRTGGGKLGSSHGGVRIGPKPVGGKKRRKKKQKGKKKHAAAAKTSHAGAKQS